MMNGSTVKEVVDVGINRVEPPPAKKGYRVVGGVDFDSVKERIKAITPVPGGVGPMIATVPLHNILKAYRIQRGQ